MKLGTQLYNIANTEGVTRECLIDEFELEVRGHKDELVLLVCLDAAKRGETFICWGRTFIIPNSLQEEGFFVEEAGSGFNLCWE